MPVTPTSPEAHLLDNLRESIANSTVFQTAVGAVDPAGALPHIYILENVTEDDTLPEPGMPSLQRPFALLEPPITTYRTELPGIPLWSIRYRFEMDVAEVLAEDIYFAAANFFGGVNNDLSQILSAKTAVTFAKNLARMETITSLIQYQRVRPSANEDYMVGLFEIVGR